jgi:hypothetical protein
MNQPSAAEGALPSLREFFSLRGAERTVAAYEPAQQARVQAHAAAAARRLSAGRRTLEDVPAASLMLDAVRHYLLAARAAQSRASTASTDEANGVDLARELPPLSADPTRPDAAPTDDARVREALAALDSLYLDRLPAEDAARLRGALDRAAGMLAGRVEARSLLNVRATRWGRRAAVAVVAAYGLWATAAAIWLPKNVARDKPVHASSSRHGDGHELVDGEIATVPGLMTGVEESPSATIDLVDLYAIDEIRVYNRIDQSFDDSLPMAVEVSVDGSLYRPLGRRDEHFSADPPWIVSGRHEAGRFVRIKALKRGYLALSEVEVYGKKLPKGPPPPHP